jgi:hypothetical protein
LEINQGWLQSLDQNFGCTMNHDKKTGCETEDLPWLAQNDGWIS